MDVIAKRQRKFLDVVLEGKRGIRNTHDAEQLIAAICGQKDRLSCVVNLCRERSGFTAVQKALHLDLSNTSLNGRSAQLILYLTSEDIRQINGGKTLCDILTAIMTPPLLWKAYKSAAIGHDLTTSGLHAFASLILDFMTLLSPSSELGKQIDIKNTAQEVMAGKQLHRSDSANVRSLAYKIDNAICCSSLSGTTYKTTDFKPGGRHDNDFADFRRISIFPSKDELLSAEPPYMLSAYNVLSTSPEQRVAMHLDNQFRLLREDMLAELRDDLKNTLSPTSGKRRSMRIRGLQLSGIGCGATTRLRPAAIALRCFDYEFKRLPEEEEKRKKYFIDNKTIAKHGAFGCLVIANEIIAFATIDRDEDLLAKVPSILLLRILGQAAVSSALLTLKLRKPHEIDFVLVDTPYFAYEPVLTCLQSMPSLPLADVILGLKGHDPDTRSPYGLETLAGRIRELEGKDLSSLIDAAEAICLDKAQTQSLVAGLTQVVSQIQGPPGTGKSFIGAILTRLLLDYVEETTILVICYTNHALDQFLEDLLDVGVNGQQMLRLGSKSTLRTAPMTINGCGESQGRMPQAEWTLCRNYKSDAEDTAREASRIGKEFSCWRQSEKDILESLEFSERDLQFFYALSVPNIEGGMAIAGADGKPIGSTYLFQRWIQGKDAGVVKNHIEARHNEIWSMNRADRQKCFARWSQATIAERAEFLADEMQAYDSDYTRWRTARDTRIAELMKTKRIIGCTTTAAAKYADQIALTKPGIVLVEEAGEVLESHILTALSRETKQLIMIGDHLQLRPKIKNYGLTVEAGEGFDLNCSLFERLILGGHPHTVLTKQHRMRPQVSTLVRRLMYPELEDSEEVFDRPDILGIQQNVVFIDHQKAEVSDGRLKERQDETSTVSRQNVFEAKMILKIVRYLAQQGYGTDKQVVLTPYLGQLRLIMDELKDDHDPVLSDLDSYDLVKAGLLTQAGASQMKRQLRLSTIDNFQGEESDIVIVSLTRSNERGDIGFMSAPQRLNVLLSRARSGLIMIGNAQTFRQSKKGSAVWNPFFDQLVENGQFFRGLPVKCERHPSKTAILETPEDFEEHCPNGGCHRPCGTMLSCRKHQCPEKCHQLVDHSKQACLVKVVTQCANGHRYNRECWRGSQPCAKCERDIKLQRIAQKKQDDYLASLIAIEDKIDIQRKIVQDLEEQVKRATVLKQKQDDLATATRSAHLKTDAQTQSSTEKTPATAPTKNRDADSNSKAVQNWEHQKTHEKACNEHIDAVMRMIGLESVKLQVLNVKDKVDITLRQAASLSKERFNVLLLGNPGTGKTTVARHYAKCLASMGVVAGGAVQETSASKLTNAGVSGYKKMIDELLNNGGGALFVDEAYQLVSGPNAMGRQLLDAVMDDAENLTGKVVFILAGYRKEMETLLAHNPGLTSRFPYEFNFEDYSDDELLRIFQYQMREHYKGQMKLEGGEDGLYVRIVARRVGYGRGRPGFANARAMDNAAAKIRSRQATRIAATRRRRQAFDDFMLTKEDMLGPEPSGALEKSKAWTTLQDLIGLNVVKKAVHSLMQSLRINYDRELREEPLVQFNLNRVFLGSPGTGKTTVAKLYGQILADLGLLSNGEVIVKNPSDFVGAVLGASEQQTKGILASSSGKVLVIDEAYGLYSPTGVGQSSDIYKSAVVDTLVAEVQSVPGDDRCVLLLGYQDEMERMLQNTNQGLARRFPLSEAFLFEDFTDDELKQVLGLKLRQQAYNATDDATKEIMEILQRARNKPHFGNAGEVDIILNSAKGRHLQRCAEQGLFQDTTLEPVDVNPTLTHTDKVQLSISELFKDNVGHDQLVTRLEQIRNVVVNLRSRGVDPREQVPYNFVFCGPPGTGKTTTARKMGQIYHDIGILADSEVLERSASDLIGQYLGHTAEKTKKLLESALGKILLIDEAYRLADGQFAKEATDELVDLLTKPRFARKLIVILAGYDHDIERLMATNPGLTSRFPEKVTFHSLPPKACATLLIARLARESYLDVSAIQALPSSDAVTKCFETLATLGSWANARDVENLAKVVGRGLIQKLEPSSTKVLRVTERRVLSALNDMIQERQKRAALLQPVTTPFDSLPSLRSQRTSPIAAPPLQGEHNKVGTSTSISKKYEQPPPPEEIIKGGDAGRDDGVSDEVWAALATDKVKAAEADQLFADVVAQHQEEERIQAEEEARHGGQDDSEGEEDEAEAQKARLRREQERLRYEFLRRQKEEMEAKRKHEQKVQQKLRAMGVCCQGFQWIKQPSGYRCAGGGHFLSNAALVALM